MKPLSFFKAFLFKVFNRDAEELQGMDAGRRREWSP